MKCWLHLINGWTVSISYDDVPPALCSVAAWPSEYDNKPWSIEEKWFKFGDSYEERCHSLEDVRKALSKVEAASPPTSN